MARKRRRPRRTGVVVTVAAAVLVAPVLPIAVLRWVRPVVTPFMVARWVTDGAGIDRRWMPLRAMSPALPRAVVAAEDARFVPHDGKRGEVQLLPVRVAR